jgi:hypothetical protein
MISSFFLNCAGSRVQPKPAGIKKAVREKMLAPAVGSKKVDPVSSLPPEARLLAKPQVQVCTVIISSAFATIGSESTLGFPVII